MITNKRWLCPGHETKAYLVDHPVYGNNIVEKVFGGNSEGSVVWLNKQKFILEVIYPVMSQIVSTPYNIAKIFGIENQNLYEEFRPGKYTVQSLFDKLLKNEQDDILFAIASFMNDTHNHFPVLSLNSYLQTRAIIGCDYSFNESLVKMKDVLSDKEIEQLQNCVEKLKTNELANVPVFVMSYSDYKPRNILYDEQAKKLSVIDFGECFYALPERDYSCFLESNQTGAFNSQIMDIYKQLPKKESPQEMDPKVKECYYDFMWLYSTIRQVFGEQAGSFMKTYEAYKSRFDFIIPKIIKNKIYAM